MVVSEFLDMKEPRLSVLMSVYKEPIEWLKQSVDSILQQTFKDFEFIIVCDNPSYTNGIDLLKSYSDKDKRIVLLFNGTNIGLTKSLNRGLAIARGDYIARMDADDVSLSGRLEQQVQFLHTHPEISVVHSYIQYFGDDINENKVRRSPLCSEKIIDTLMYSNCINHPAVMFRKADLLNNQIKYDEIYRRSQDYALWLQMALKGLKFATIPKVLFQYRLSGSQITYSHRAEQLADEKRIKRDFFRKVCEINKIEYPKQLTRNYIKSFRANKALGVNHIIIIRALKFQMYYSLPKTITKFVRLIPDAVCMGLSTKQTIIILLSFILDKRWSGYDMNYLIEK